jgi:hypothetical protein
MRPPIGYRLGDHVHQVIRCPKNCGRLLINGIACSCTWRPEPDPDPLVGQLALVTDKSARQILAYGVITDVDRDDGALTTTITPGDQ